MRVLVLADDLIWSTRLIAQVQAAGADAAPVRTLSALNQALPAADAVIVDLTARAYDGIVAVRKAADAGRRVLAVGQHDDAEMRRRALAAGAERVLPYRKLFEDGEATLTKWLAETPSRAGSRR
jgi:DNA-binding NarL/FixJ family response regulator